MRVPVKLVYLDCTSPACPSGVIADAEWDQALGAVFFVGKDGANKAVPFVQVRELTLAPVPYKVAVSDLVPRSSVKVRKKQ